MVKILKSKRRDLGQLKQAPSAKQAEQTSSEREPQGWTRRGLVGVGVGLKSFIVRV